MKCYHTILYLTIDLLSISQQFGTWFVPGITYFSLLSNASLSVLLINA